MRKFFILAILFFSFSISYSQIKVIETVPIEKIGRVGTNGSSDIYIQKEGNEYKLVYKNTEPEDAGEFSSFSFKDLNGDFENFYTLINTGFNATPVADIKLELPNDFVWLHYIRNLQKVVTLQFMSSNKVSSTTGISDVLSKSDVAKLFGKN